jgi:hypothetical protein
MALTLAEPRVAGHTEDTMDLATVADVSVGAAAMLLFVWGYYTDMVSTRG